MPYKALIGNKYIGRSRPVLFLCADMSNIHLWDAAWFLMGDHDLGINKQEVFSFKAPNTLDLNEFMDLDGFEKYMIDAAEGYFHNFLHSTHPKYYQVASGLIQNIEFISSTDPQRLIVSTAFHASESQVPFLQKFEEDCCSSELAEAISLGLRFRREIKIG